MMKKTDIFYSLTIEDIQNVAQEGQGRKLTDDEIKKVISLVEELIPWYDIIDDAIGQAL